MTSVGLSKETLIDLIYNTANSFVPTDELEDEQLTKFDNIRYEWCNCGICKRSSGHADKNHLKIGLSWAHFGDLFEWRVPISLFDVIVTALHEIVHILFPEYNEIQTEAKVKEWALKSIDEYFKKDEVKGDQ